MATETCGICGRQVLYSESVHATINTRSEAGVVDYYVCGDCYETELVPLFGMETPA